MSNPTPVSKPGSAENPKVFFDVEVGGEKGKDVSFLTSWSFVFCFFLYKFNLTDRCSVSMRHIHTQHFPICLSLRYFQTTLLFINIFHRRILFFVFTDL